MKPVTCPLDLKIKLAENIIIEEHMRHNGNIFISWSGGKDSEVLMHIALRLFPHLRIVYSNTTNEMKEVLDHVKKFQNVITVFPKMNFKQAIKKYGFPLVSKEISQKAYELKNTNGYRNRMLRLYGNHKGDSKLPQKWQFLAEQEFDVSSKCCDILKKIPIQNWAKENGDPIPLIALMKDESRLRQQLALYGKEDEKKSYPFLRTGWTEEDIWAYAEMHNIRFAECYYDRTVDSKLIKAVDRSGCDACDFGTEEETKIKFDRSKALSPKKHANMMKQTNNGVTYQRAREIAYGEVKNTSLGLYGGLVTSIDYNTYTDTRIYHFDIVSDVYRCDCCGKEGLKSKTKDKSFKLSTSFYDTPCPDTGKKRVIVCSHYFFECQECGMTLNSNLHMFDQRFFVTKRLIDYIYQNLNKKDEMTIADETGVPVDDVFEITTFAYAKAFKKAKEHKFESIWFNRKKELLVS